MRHADQHLLALANAMEKFNSESSGQYALKTDFDAASREFTARIDGPKPPQEIGLLVGDVVHSWRSTLDNMVECMLVRNEWPPTSSHQFPIASADNSKTRRDFSRFTEGIRAVDLAEIKDLQPHVLGDDADGHPLAALRDLANYDKHHVILPAMHAWAMRIKPDGSDEWLSVTDHRIAFRPGVSIQTNFWIRGIENAEIETFSIEAGNPDNRILRLTLKDIDGDPVLHHDEIPVEMIFWTPTNTVNFARLEHIRLVLWAQLRQLNARWLTEDGRN